MRFEWDETKNAINIRKHGVDFELACEAFDDQLGYSEQDRFVFGEERWWRMCLVHGRLLYVAFTTSENGGEEVVRIISARKATRQERRSYERGT